MPKTNHIEYPLNIVLLYLYLTFAYLTYRNFAYIDIKPHTHDTFLHFSLTQPVLTPPPISSLSP